MGWKVDSPESVQEKVEAIHDLATDDAVAAVVTTDFLRRPAVADRAMADDTARHAVNEAQFDRFRQQAQFVHQEAALQLQRMEHSAALAEYLIHAGGIGFGRWSRPIESPVSRGAGWRGMMIGRAAETGVPGCDERGRDAATAADE